MRYSICSGLAAGFACCTLLCGFANTQNASELLARAEKLADSGDRYNAGPLFAKAEEQFRIAGNAKEELYAKLGRLHAESQQGNYQAIKAQVERALSNPIVQSDPQLKIKALSVLGVIDLNIDTSAAASDWKEALKTATVANDAKWQNRAQGQLGIVAGINGNMAEAGTALFRAIATAEKMGDINGAINFIIWLANGMALNGMADSALKQLDRASDLAQQSGYERVPFILSIARMRAIAHLPEPERSKRMSEAETLFKSTMQLAEADEVPGAEIELLNQHGQFALESGNLAEAEHAFSRAASIAHSAELPGLEAEALLNIARMYLQTGHPEKADQILSLGVKRLKGVEGRVQPASVCSRAS